jgi:hypothetical protein
LAEKKNINSGPGLLARVPFFVAGIPVFFVWHKLNENFGLIPLSAGLELLAFYIAIVAAMLLCWRLMVTGIRKTSSSHRWRAAGLMAGVCSIVYLFWGAIHDFLKTSLLPPFFSSYSFLFSLLFIFLVAGILFLRKRQPALLTFTRFGNSLLLLLLVMEAGLTLYYVISDRKQSMQLAYDLKPVLNKYAAPPDSVRTSPDIFLIVWDEYASSASLKRYQNFDNYSLDSSLRAKGYYVAESSKSNYNSTPHSLASMLSLDYFPTQLENAATDPPAMLLAQQAYRTASLPPWLADQGYEILNLGLMDFENHPAPFESFFNRDWKQSMLHENLPRRVHSEIWWKLVDWFPALNWSRDAWKKRQQQEINVFRHNWTSLLQAWQSTSDRPRFVMAHFMLPHMPFNFNANGERRDLGYFEWSTQRDSLYLDQLQYVNKLIDSLTVLPYDTVMRPRVVIIMGDHGFRDQNLHPTNRIRPKQFENLTAVYYSDQEYVRLYPSITPINNMRLLVNKYFGYQLPLLADSSIMLR